MGSSQRHPKRQVVKLAGRAAHGLLASAVLMVLVITIAAPGASAGAAPSPTYRTRNARVADPGVPYAVGVRTETFVDMTRPTQENHGVAAQPSRTLVTTIFYPAKGQPVGGAVSNAPAVTSGRGFPLVVFAHGSNGAPSTFAGQLSQWAAAGYVIAAPKFPLTGANVPGGPNFADYVNQPGDLSVVITQMLHLSRDKHSPYSGLIDPRRIGAVGDSLGAATVVGLGYNTCCIDKRVKAIVSISGAKEFPGTGSFAGTFSYPDTPLLLIRGADANADLAYEPSQQLFSEAHTPKFLMTVTHGTHVPIKPEDAAGGSAARQAVIDFLDRYLKQDNHALSRLVSDANNPEVATLQQAPTR